MYLPAPGLGFFLAVLYPRIYLVVNYFLLLHYIYNNLCGIININEKISECSSRRYIIMS
jgi:hypothetical protein